MNGPSVDPCATAVAFDSVWEILRIEAMRGTRRLVSMLMAWGAIRDPRVAYASILRWSMMIVAFASNIALPLQRHAQPLICRRPGSARAPYLRRVVALH